MRKLAVTTGTRLSPSSPSSGGKEKNLNDKNCEENEIRKRNKKKVESFAENAETVEKTLVQRGNCICAKTIKTELGEMLRD